MIWIFAVIMWCLCAIVGWLVAKPKGRETEGLLLGFVLGPLGVIVAALLETKQLGAARPRSIQSFNCPRCGRPLPKSSSGRGTCSACGHVAAGC